MAKYASLDQLIGNTPLLQLHKYAAQAGAAASLNAKLEYMNPAGSTKDRAALSMILRAEEQGLIKPGAVIIEPTSGNTGIGLSWIAATRAYKALIVMPESMSLERRNLMRAYGAELVLTDAKLGMQGAIEKARALALEIPNSFVLSQFENPANPEAHRRTTGPELWRDTEGELDILVCSVGTGGTITGCGEFLKSMNPAIRVVAVEPTDSPVLSGGLPAPHGIQGIGAGFVPKALNTAIYDEILCVTTEDALKTAQTLARTEGLLCGISSGAALWAATELSLRPENAGKSIAVVLPDGGERYLSVPGFLPEG